MTNMTLPQIAKAVNGKLYINGSEADKDEIYPLTEAQGVVIDSRLCEKNSIFVAVKGEKADGHDYIEKVLDEGALGAICEKLPAGYEKRTKGAYILVDDTFVIPDIPPLSMIESDMSTLYFKAGKKEKISKADILGFIVNNSTLNASQIGQIVVKDHYALVAIPRSEAQIVLQCLQSCRIKGKKLPISITGINTRKQKK